MKTTNDDAKAAESDVGNGVDRDESSSSETTTTHPPPQSAISSSRTITEHSSVVHESNHSNASNSNDNNNHHQNHLHRNVVDVKREWTRRSSRSIHEVPPLPDDDDTTTTTTSILEIKQRWQSRLFHGASQELRDDVHHSGKEDLPSNNNNNNNNNAYVGTSIVKSETLPPSNNPTIISSHNSSMEQLQPGAFQVPGNQCGSQYEDDDDDDDDDDDVATTRGIREGDAIRPAPNNNSTSQTEDAMQRLPNTAATTTATTNTANYDVFVPVATVVEPPDMYVHGVVEAPYKRLGAYGGVCLLLLVGMLVVGVWSDQIVIFPNVERKIMTHRDQDQSEPHIEDATPRSDLSYLVTTKDTIRQLVANSLSRFARAA